MNASTPCASSAWALAAYGAMEAELKRKPLTVSSSGINQAGISTAVAWQFTQQVLPEMVSAKNYPALCALSVRAEALPAFVAAPHGDSAKFFLKRSAEPPTPPPGTPQTQCAPRLALRTSL